MHYGHIARRGTPRELIRLAQNVNIRHGLAAERQESKHHRRKAAPARAATDKTQPDEPDHEGWQHIDRRRPDPKQRVAGLNQLARAQKYPIQPRPHHP